MMDLRPTSALRPPTHYRGKSSGGNWGSQGSEDNYSISNSSVGIYGHESDDDAGGSSSGLMRSGSAVSSHTYRICSLMDLGARQAKLIAEVQELLGIEPCPGK